MNFSLVSSDPKKLLEKTFEDIELYNDIVILKNIILKVIVTSHGSIIGRATIGYTQTKELLVYLNSKST